jgi:hypothetical protein
MKHTDQVLKLLLKQVGSQSEVNDISKTASEVIAKVVNPVNGGKEETNGLIYGLVQSGKTGVLTATGAMGADEGYRTIIILTSDIDPLYLQTLGRVQEAFPGIDILGKGDIRDPVAFSQRIKSNACAIVVTKNANILGTLIQNFKTAKVKGLSCLLIDDEADQASLNTRARKADGSQSAINGLISEIRSFFQKNTYLQVTATPQSLFLQEADHPFRPKFTVLSHPGKDYVGGDDFFGEDSPLIKTFELQEIGVLLPGAQPNPALNIPSSLLQALDMFMVAATYKRLSDVDQNCAFLCHVSTKTADHEHIVNLLRKYKIELAQQLKNNDDKTLSRLQKAFKDLAATHEGLAKTSFKKLVEAIAFLSAGIAVKLVNGDTDEDVAVRSPYNLFVGGSKLGRGVTIRNLLVSYYGRNPRLPQADTVLQHARMYGYRRKDIGLLRLFLPPELLQVFRAINRMEKSLRELIAKKPSEEFRGIYVEGGVSPTRRAVIAPGTLGVYTAGSNYNPAQVLRDSTVEDATSTLDLMLKAIGNKSTKQIPISTVIELLQLTMPDEKFAEFVWDTTAICGSIEQFAKLRNAKTGAIYVDRDRDIAGPRRETQGILSGGEVASIPDDVLGLFMIRTREKGQTRASWWPQIRFPGGRYAFAFAM